ncbi:MAG: ABC transporter permease [Phycisphaerales bacterium]
MTTAAVTAPAMRRLLRRPSVIASACLLAAIALACLGSLPWTLGWFGEGAPPYRAQNLEAAHAPPLWSAGAEDNEARFALGADSLGRSLLVRCLAGGGVSLTIGLAAALLSVGIGTLWGCVAAYAGGRVDALMMRIVDVLYGLPYILLVVLLAVAVDALVDRVAASGAPLGEAGLKVVNVVTLLVAIGGVSWLTMARVVRAQALSLKEQPFMEASRAIGAPMRRQLIRHLLPNLVGVIIVYATLTAPQAVLQESFLSVLGSGVQAPLPSWGNLASDGLEELNTVRPRWWLLLFPSLLLGVTLVAFNILGEGLREALDPRSAQR